MAPPRRQQSTRTAWQTHARRLQQEGSVSRWKLGTQLLNLPSRHTPIANGSRQLIRSSQPQFEVADEYRNLTQNSENDKSAMLPPICVQIGGLREDPFMSYPIEFKSYLPEAFDYCECATALLIRPLKRICF